MPSRGSGRSGHQVSLRSRLGEGLGETVPVAVHLDLEKLAVVICDMWNAVNCRSANRRVAEMAPQMNAVVAQLRCQGSLVIHAPSDCMAFYAGTPQRRRAYDAPRAEAPTAFGWNDWDPKREAPLPDTLTDKVQCSCDTPEPCTAGGPPFPWKRQTELLTIAPEDAVTDDGQEVFNLLEHRGIDDVIVMGVHTNRCILGRPFGIRQLAYVEKRPILCRDLTDAFHRDSRGHAWGTQATVAHIERYWCPTVTSDQLVGGERFMFSRE